MDNSRSNIYKVLSKPGLFILCYCIFFLVGCLIYFNLSKTGIHLFINDHFSRDADILFQVFSFLGTGLFFGIVAFILLFFKKSWGLILAVTGVIISILVQLLKHFVFPEALRPAAYFKNHDVLHLVAGVQLHSLHSFPSGHATAAFALAFCLSAFFPKKTGQLLFFIYAALVAYARMYLNQHFFEDVFAGSFLGVLVALVCYVTLTRFAFIQKPFWQKPLLRK